MTKYQKEDTATAMKSALGKVAVIVPFAFLSACMGSNPSAPDPAFAPTIAKAPEAPKVQNGAIFQATNGYAALTTGQRAAMVGDVLTVALIERTVTNKSNGANFDRGGSFGLNPPTTGPLSVIDSSDVSISGNTNFSGKGSAQQSNALQGQIAVTIAEVYPNGTYLVKGEKLMTLSRGDEHIRFSGIVRAADITPDNVVLSSRVANANITYSGSGEIQRANKQGWLQKFFNIISPF